MSISNETVRLWTMLQSTYFLACIKKLVHKLLRCILVWLS